MTHRPHPTAHTPPDIEAPDAWHRHIPGQEDSPQKPHGEITNAHLIVLFGVGSFVIVLVCCIAVYAYYIGFSTSELDKAELSREAGPETEARSLKADAMAKLDRGNAWGDHDNVQIRISDAMKAVAEQYAARKD